MNNPAVNDILESNYRNANRLMVGILWALFLASLAISGRYDTLHWALAVGLPAAAVPTLLVAVTHGSRAARVSIGIAFMVFCGLHIHQTAGQTEAHFGIFALLAFLLCYRDWLVIVAAAATVAVHHLTFDYLQQLGFPTYCLTRPGIGMVLVHAGYVVGETGVLCFLAVLLKREAVQAAELRVAVQAMTGEPGVIDLRTQDVPRSSESARTLAAMTRLLQQTMASVKDSVRSTAAASAQIADGNAALSLHTERQSASICATVASMSELTTTVQANAEHAREADTLAGNAAQVAERGGAVVGQVIDTMDAIDAASRKIVDITGVIDGIAFQTNLLALNAAVEAARAGEQGRGFAVVAGEVRMLAQRAASAAKEIKQLIDDSVRRVEAGSALASQAGSTMDEVVASVRRVSGIVADINSASSAQAREIAAIGQTMTAMGDATRESGARVDEAAGAASALKTQAEELAHVVSVFRVDADPAAPPAPAARRPVAARAGASRLVLAS